MVANNLLFLRSLVGKFSTSLLLLTKTSNFAASSHYLLLPPRGLVARRTLHHFTTNTSSTTTAATTDTTTSSERDAKTKQQRRKTASSSIVAAAGLGGGALAAVALLSSVTKGEEEAEKQERHSTSHHPTKKWWWWWTKSAATAEANKTKQPSSSSPPPPPASSGPTSPITFPLEAPTSKAPDVPPPLSVERLPYPATLRVELDAREVVAPLSRRERYRFWTFGGRVPGPFIRARVGDTLEVRVRNSDASGVGHNVDLHAVCGPGGGSQLLFAEQEGDVRAARFRLLYPGLFVYHCAAAPIPMHIAQGMYGLVLVEPVEGERQEQAGMTVGAVPLAPVDREFYVMQSEFYTEPADDDEEDGEYGGEEGGKITSAWKNRKSNNGSGGGKAAPLLVYSYTQGLAEQPQYVVFNGHETALTDAPLRAAVGERVRIYFGNAGPNLTAAFHVIGCVFDRVYRDGGLLDPPARGLQTVLVPPGGATVVELVCRVPGTYVLVDHAIHRIDKGAIGFLKVCGEPEEGVYESVVIDEEDGKGEGDPSTTAKAKAAARGPPAPCPGCKMHE